MNAGGMWMMMVESDDPTSGLPNSFAADSTSIPACPPAFPRAFQATGHLVDLGLPLDDGALSFGGEFGVELCGCGGEFGINAGLLEAKEKLVSGNFHDRVTVKMMSAR